MPWRRQGTGKATEHYYAKQVDYVQRNRKVKENYAKPLDKACHRVEENYAKQMDDAQRGRKVKGNYAKPWDEAPQRTEESTPSHGTRHGAGKVEENYAKEAMKAVHEKSDCKLCQAMG